MTEVLADGRVQWWKSNGEGVWVTPGVIDQTAIDLFRHGSCLFLAVAISEMTGWPIGLVRPSVPVVGRIRPADSGPDQVVDWVDGPRLRWVHAVVQTPYGGVLDIAGHQWPTEVCAYWDAFMPDHGPYYYEVVDWEDFLDECNSGGEWWWRFEQEHELSYAFGEVLLAELGH